VPRGRTRHVPDRLKFLNLGGSEADIEAGLGFESPETAIAMASVALGVVLLALSILVLVWGFPGLPTTRRD
jgi:hypothetical protein